MTSPPRLTTPESQIVKSVQLAATRIGARLFRNNVAKAWVGVLEKYMEIKTVTLHPGDVILRRARPLHAGLIEGSSDEIGWTPVTVTHEMVGKTLAVFTAAECKTAVGRLTPEQRNFLEAVRASGGIGACVRSGDELEREIGDFKDRLLRPERTP